MGFLKGLGIDPAAGGQNMSQGVMGFKPVDLGQGQQGPQKWQQAMSHLGSGLQQMGQGGGEAPQLPDMGDPLAVLRNMGFDFGANHLGRLR